VSELVHVQLGGAMAKNFGRHWKLKVRNTKQAIDLIEANRPGFKAWIKRNRNHFDKYHIQVTNKQGHKWSMDDTEYQMMGESENIAKIRITPVPRGSGGKAFGWFQTFVGAAMIAVGAWLWSDFCGCVIRAGDGRDVIDDGRCVHADFAAGIKCVCQTGG
jgi:predicted phage tail protein